MPTPSITQLVPIKMLSLRFDYNGKRRLYTEVLFSHTAAADEVLFV